MSYLDAETILLKHLSVRLPDVGGGPEIARYLKKKYGRHEEFIETLSNHYLASIADGINPMTPQTEWASILGLTYDAVRGHWYRLRSWMIDGIYVFEDGLQALRQGTWVIEGEKRRIVHPGIALRPAFAPFLPIEFAQKVVDSTVENTRVATATTHYAARSIEESTSATAFEKKAVREARASTLHPIGQLEMPIFGKKKRKSA